MTCEKEKKNTLNMSRSIMLQALLTQDEVVTERKYARNG